MNLIYETFFCRDAGILHLKVPNHDHIFLRCFVDGKSPIGWSYLLGYSRVSMNKKKSD